MSSVDDGHLFVLIHGLWGGPHHVSVIEQVLKESLKDENIYTVIPKGFAFFRTYDGIKRCSEIVIDEIFNRIEELNDKKNVKITKISFVGYSLGGLIARYCIGELMKLNNFFDLIRPVFFTTFATPHLGTRFFDNSVFHLVLNTLGTNLLGQTGRDLFIADSDKLLVKLLEPDGAYYKGLSRFDKRIVISNIRNDRTVPFYTSFVTQYNPFLKWEEIKLKYVEDVPEIEIGGKQIRPRLIDFANCSRVLDHKTSYSSDKILRYILILAAVVFILPFWLPVVFVASCFGTIQSAIRGWLTPAYDIKQNWERVLSSSLKPKTKKKSHEHPIEEEFAEITENYVEGVLAAEDRLHGEQEDTDLVSTDNDNDNKFAGLVKYDFKKSVKFVESHQDTIFREGVYLDINESPFENLQRDYPIFQVDDVQINLGDDRTAMLRNFNTLPTIKLPVYIDSFNAHDGIISRRGIRTSPRGTATILLWCSILQNSLADSS